jgi:hypothetical protein
MTVQLTVVLQVHAKFHVTMTTGGNVEVSLNFVAFNRAEDTARIWHAMQTRSFLELLLRLPRSSQIVMNILLFTLPVNVIV